MVGSPVFALLGEFDDNYKANVLAQEYSARVYVITYQQVDGRLILDYSNLENG